jgi:predicted 3-demethylubiquinone-9 3-methyltransferase (glyoxalase superfamily)
MLSENNYKRAWSFTPEVSLFIERNSENEINTLYKKRSSNGS